MPTNIRNPPHRRVIIVEWGALDSANSYAADWDPDSGGDDTFGDIELSSDGSYDANGDPTHTACNTVATDEMLDGVQTVLDNVPFVAMYSLNDGETPHELFERALADQGLQVIEPEGI